MPNRTAALLALTLGVTAAGPSSGAPEPPRGAPIPGTLQTAGAEHGPHALEVRMATLLDLDMRSTPADKRDEQLKEQWAWMRTLGACGTERTCVEARYQSRIDGLQQGLIQRLCARPGAC